MTSALESRIAERILSDHRLLLDQLQPALELSQATPCSLEQALWRLQLMPPAEFVEYTAQVAQVPTLYQWLETKQLELTLASQFSETALLELEFFPCAWESSSLVVAVRDPDSRDVFSRIQSVYPNADIRFVVATHNQLESLVVQAGLRSRQLTIMQWRELASTTRYSGVTIGQALTNLGFVKGLEYLEIVSAQLNLPLLFRQPDAEQPAPDGDLIRQFDLTTLLRLQFVPYAWLNERRLMVMMQYPLDLNVEEVIYQRFPGIELVKVLGTERDITQLIDRFYNQDFSWQATYQLMTHSPTESAAQVMTLSQVMIIYGLVVLILWGLLSDWWSTLVVLMALLNIFFVAAIGFKLVLSLVGATDQLYRINDAEVAALDSQTLPIYTILIPIYKEAEILPILLQALAHLDYPKERLDVLLLFEETDIATIEAAKDLFPPRYIRFIYVPDSQPKTKPKALNYALPFARGEYLTIYDAEDIPEPDQLKKAIIAFKNGSSDLICVQAALNYFNYDENLLTRMFTLEYSYWFDYIVPGLQTLRCPIPLGGTSNHFRIDRLRELGGWDPFNVTEDADLGIRASERGYRIGVINSTTYEEANCELHNWIRQRSRWLKGYMQTWLVHTRFPIRSIQRLGLRKWAAAQIFIGGTILSFITTPILWLIFCYWLATRAAWLDNLYPEWVLYISLFNLIFSNALGVYLNMIAVFRRRYYSLIFYSLLNPLYWLLHSVAGYMAIWQFYHRPFYWEKTKHGLSRLPHPNSPAD